MVKHKEIQSDSGDEARAHEPRFRIRVCMSRVHRDERARVLLCVSRARRVRWLQRRLRRLFALPPAFHLLSRGHLLPPDEPLALLDRDDLVEVVPVNEAIDGIVPAGDVVDSVGRVPEELRPSRSRSRSPVLADDLSETKRKALLVLEQYCTDVPARDTRAEGADRPRRRRVRRRRRAPPVPDAGELSAHVSRAEDADKLSTQMSAEDADKFSTHMSAEDSDKLSMQMSAEDADKFSTHMSAEDSDKLSTHMSAEDADKLSTHMSAEDADKLSTHMFGEDADEPPARWPAEAAGGRAGARVLRRELRPRAPRVVRPLHAPPTSIVSRSIDQI